MSKKVKINCAFCGKEIAVSKSYFEKTKTICCSLECKHKIHSHRMSGNGNPNWRGGSIELTCDNCGKIIYKPQYAVDLNNKHFCDNKCMGEWRSANCIGDKASNWKDNNIEIACDYCGKKVLKKAWQLANVEHTFCDKQCYDAWQTRNRIQRKCANCGKILFVTQYKDRINENHFCSVQCRGEWYSKNLSNENSPFRKGEISICVNCGKEFYRSPSTFRNKNNRFCSYRCMGEYRTGENSPSWNGGKVIICCSQCGLRIERSPSAISITNFCSTKCHGDWLSENNIGDKSSFWRGGKIDLNCSYCGAILQRPRYWAKQGKDFFCKSACRKAWQSDNLRRENNPNWLGGISYEPYDSEFNRELKLRIRQRDSFTCQVCGVLENGIALAVHHINYDKKDSSPQNLVSLCTSCHSKTNARRDYWTRYLHKLLSHQYGYFYNRDKARRGRLIVY